MTGPDLTKRSAATDAAAAISIEPTESLNCEFPPFTDLCFERGNLNLSFRQNLVESSGPDALTKIEIGLKDRAGLACGSIFIHVAKSEDVFKILELFEGLALEDSCVTPGVLKSFLQLSRSFGEVAISSDLIEQASLVSEEYARKLALSAPAGEARDPLTRVSEYAENRFKESVEQSQTQSAARWIDIETPNRQCLEVLADKHKISPEAISDCLRFDVESKSEDFGDHLLLTTHLVLPGVAGSPEPEIQEVHFLVGDKFVISVHQKPLPGFDRIRNKVCRLVGDAETKSEALILYHLLQAINKTNESTLAKYDAQIDSLSDKLAHSGPLPREDLRSTLPKLGNSLSFFHKLAVAAENIPKRLVEFFTDKAVHDLQIALGDSYRSILGQTTYLQKRVAELRSTHSALAQDEANKQQRQLNILVGLGFPTTIITGVFGMNLNHPLSDSTIWAGVGIGVGVGVALMVPIFWNWLRSKT